jgi:hypothetical protein
MRILQFLVRRHVFGVRYFAVEGHDWPKCVTFGNEAQLAWREVVIFTMAIHLLFLNCFQIVLL